MLRVGELKTELAEVEIVIIRRRGSNIEEVKSMIYLPTFQAFQLQAYAR